ncbi:HI0074 family nucleotidyltransferase substrate-binding subunit [Verrucomicrobium sp. 3C]|uniref:HI0074 family nucleotidyltransferase substrate-binding subunit n=1 Tax=Verrucomicrobium sp. 3C TaxID=1134055 RepID=UPI0003828819|nr:HI0074 family nucleotidyltransferase substrate-binding subunit [Verrucomicrobium sp. 3C]
MSAPKGSGREEKRLADLEKALARWEEALSAPSSEMARDSAILRFELAYEVGWKAAAAMARRAGLEAPGPRAAFEAAFSLGWTSGEELWDRILRARNLAVHVYQEELAQELFRQLPEFWKGFAELLAGMRRELGGGFLR